MTEGERQVWAAVFAAEWRDQLRHKTEYNAPMDLPVAVENAWSAVVEMREAVRETAAQFGDDDEVTNALQEMLR